MTQRQPRLHDKGYLAFLHTKRCCVCGGGLEIHAAHIRMGLTGMGRKPDDSRAVPLCFWCHIGDRGSQHSMSEEKFWAMHSLDPFAIADKLYAEYNGTGGKAKPPQKVRPRKPREQRAKVRSSKKPIPHRPLRGRSAWPPRKKDRVPDL